MMSRLRSPAAILLAILACCLTPPALAQTCGEGWLPGGKFPGVDGSVYAMTPWDPDGAGPATPRIALAGMFNVAGDLVTPNIAAYDPVTSTLSPIGDGIPGAPDYTEVYDIVTLPSGHLVAAGNFSISADGIESGPVALWDGAGWSPLGTGAATPFGAPVYALAAAPNGDICAAWYYWGFHEWGIGVSRWNGQFWAHYDMPNFQFFDELWSVAVMHDGSVVAAGSIPGNVLRWDGADWTTLGAGLPAGQWANSLLVLPDGRLVAAGNGVSVWDGVTWTQQPNFIGTIKSQTLLPNGHVLMGGYFQASGATAAIWDGATFTPLEGLFSNGGEAVAALPDGTMFVSGNSRATTPHRARGFARWDGAAWQPTCPGADWTIESVAGTPDGAVVAGGRMQITSGTSTIDVGLVARRNGADWEFIGQAQGGVTTVSIADNGDILAGGSFTSISGVNANRIARWTGAQWEPLAQGVGSAFGDITAILPMPDGGLVAAGFFTQAGGLPAQNVARWDGSAWSAMGAGLQNTASDLALLQDGTIVACGNNNLGVVRWNGVTWQSFGSRARSLAVRPNGELWASGIPDAFGYPNISRWTSSAGWERMSHFVETPTQIAALQNGNIAALFGSSANGGNPCFRLWNGAAWSQLPTQFNRQLLDVAAAGRDIALAGRISIAGAYPSPGFARYTLGNTADFNNDGDTGTDADIEAFFACLAGVCCTTCGSADFNGDGDTGTDADIESFFRVLAGGAC